MKKAGKNKTPITLTEEQIEDITNQALRVVRREYLELVKVAADKKLDVLMNQTPETREHRQFCKFSCNDLIRIFNGWFLLRYLFSEKYIDNGVELERDFYICYKDVSLIPPRERPKINKQISDMLGMKVYGDVLIAPASAFV